MRYYDPKRRDTHGDYFPMPKAVFRLGLDYYNNHKIITNSGGNPYDKQKKE